GRLDCRRTLMTESREPQSQPPEPPRSHVPPPPGSPVPAPIVIPEPAEPVRPATPERHLPQPSEPVTVPPNPGPAIPQEPPAPAPAPGPERPRARDAPWAERPEVAVEAPARRLAAQTRRDFLLFTAGVAASALGAWWLLPDRTKARLLPGALGRWLDSASARMGLSRERSERLLDRGLTFDDDVAEALYSKHRTV